jgi:hypothetical protein
MLSDILIALWIYIPVRLKDFTKSLQESLLWERRLAAIRAGDGAPTGRFQAYALTAKTTRLPRYLPSPAAVR